MKVKVAALLLDILAGRYRVKECGFKSANTEVPSPIPVLPRHPLTSFQCLALKNQVVLPWQNMS